MKGQPKRIINPEYGAILDKLGIRFKWWRRFIEYNRKYTLDDKTELKKVNSCPNFYEFISWSFGWDLRQEEGTYWQKIAYTDHLTEGERNNH